MYKYFEDIFQMMTAKTEEESLKIQIRMYDEMVLSAEANLSDLQDARDNLIYRLQELETNAAEVATEATDTETVAEKV